MGPECVWGRVPSAAEFRSGPPLPLAAWPGVALRLSWRNDLLAAVCSRGSDRGFIPTLLVRPNPPLGPYSICPTSWQFLVGG